APPGGPALEQQVESFLRVVREDVGLLAARGERIYGFLHLTFQEYLAALYLVRDPHSAAGEVIARLDDPRWREPILLALGRVGSSWGPQERDTLLEGLLDADDPLADLLPRTAVLMASALDEMAEVSDRTVQEVARRLLRAYAD